ncbi:MAG: class I SAM-dependent methyltransferase, partial [Candidatus Binatus sp.]
GAALDHLPFRSESLDLITLNNVAEHLERPREVLSEFARVLAPGGRVIIHTPNVSSYAVRIAELGRRILPKPFVMELIRYMDFREEGDVFPTYYRANTCTDLAAAAGHAGLSSEKVLLAPTRPLFYFIAPLCAAELAASRLLIRLGAERFAASVILAVFRKPA